MTDSERRRDTDGGPNPHYNAWEDAVDAIATHLQEDDTAYEDRNEAERQARRIAQAIIRRDLAVCKNEPIAYYNYNGPGGTLYWAVNLTPDRAEGLRPLYAAQPTILKQ